MFGTGAAKPKAEPREEMCGGIFSWQDGSCPVPPAAPAAQVDAEHICRNMWMLK